MSAKTKTSAAGPFLNSPCLETPPAVLMICSVARHLGTLHEPRAAYFRPSCKRAFLPDTTFKADIQSALDIAYLLIEQIRYRSLDKPVSLRLYAAATCIAATKNGLSFSKVLQARVRKQMCLQELP